MIYLVVGKSGVGKSTVVDEFCKRTSIHKVIPYTTRPIRDNEVGGIDYHFVSEKVFKDMAFNGNLTNVESYRVYSGDIWYYGFNLDEIKKYENCILVCNPKNIEGFISRLGKENIHTIEIIADLNTRIERYIDRDSMSIEKIQELVRRFISDEKEFKDLVTDDLVGNEFTLEYAVNKLTRIILGDNHGE